MKAAVFALCLALPLAAFAQSFDLKTGGWEVSIVTTGAGAPDKQTFAKCVTHEDLASGAAFGGSDAASCSRKTVERTAQRYEFDEICRDPEASRGHTSFDATSREAYTGRIDRTLEGGIQVSMVVTGHWVSPTCSDEVDD